MKDYVVWGLAALVGYFIGKEHGAKTEVVAGDPRFYTPSPGEIMRKAALDSHLEDVKANQNADNIPIQNFEKELTDQAAIN
tara:strand:+ start:1497 stop:1739 length:243 start_codon:yes stop_codon:yes gene_type:complete